MKDKELKEYLLRDAASLRALNFSENYIKETLANTEKWGGTGLLTGISDPYIGRQVARLMENQRTFNEEWQEPKIKEGVMPPDFDVHQVRRISIPVVRRVFGGSFLPHSLVSVQVISKPEDRFYYTNLEERQNSLLISANTRWVGTDWWQPNLYEGSMTRLDQEAHATADLAETYANDCASEVIRDLTNNAGSNAKAEYTDPDNLLELIEGMSSYIAAKIRGREANWIVVSPKIAEILKPFVNEQGHLKDKWALHESEYPADGTILMGHKDSRQHYFSGYFYCPYRPFHLSPEWNESSGSWHNILWSRYGKKLLDANFYGVINISNLPTTQSEEPAPEPAEEVQ